jgi:hypothetical protein
MAADIIPFRAKRDPQTDQMLIQPQRETTKTYPLPKGSRRLGIRS